MMFRANSETTTATFVASGVGKPSDVAMLSALRRATTTSCNLLTEKRTGFCTSMLDLRQIGERQDIH